MSGLEHPLISGQPAFDMQYVDYSIFYPCNPQSGGSGWTGWSPPHKRAMRDGFKKYLNKGCFSWTGRPPFTCLDIPTYPLAPLVPPCSAKYPLIIFSHGLCGSRHTYSQYCSALASNGHVVLAIESRDGSGPAVMVPNQDEHGSESPLLYISLDDLDWRQGDEGSLKQMGEIQLDMRVREIYETYSHFRHLVFDGRDHRTIRIGDNVPTNERKIDTFVDSDNLYLSGHSSGGGTVLHVLRTPPPRDLGLQALPIKGCIALDPWVELLDDSRHEPCPPTSIEKSHKVPVLCINSPRFTAWAAHFKNLHEILMGPEGTLLTLKGTTHMSFPNFALFRIHSIKPALAFLQTVGDLASAFIDDRLASHSALVHSWDRQGMALTDELGESGWGETVIHLLSEDVRSELDRVDVREKSQFFA